MDELSKSEFAALRQLIAANDRRYSERADTEAEARHLSTIAIDKRLDAQNEFRAQLKDQAAGFLTKAEQRIYEDKSSARYDDIRATVDAHNRTNWPILISLITVMLLMIAGGWSVMGLKIEAASGPLAIGIEQVKTTNSGTLARIVTLENEQTHRVSQADIAGLKENYAQLAERDAMIRADVARQSASLVALQNQLCSADVVRNLMHANDLRLFSVLWHRIFPTSGLPTDNSYYPTICSQK